MYQTIEIFKDTLVAQAHSKEFYEVHAGLVYPSSIKSLRTFDNEDYFYLRFGFKV